MQLSGWYPQRKSRFVLPPVPTLPELGSTTRKQSQAAFLFFSPEIDPLEMSLNGLAATNTPTPLSPPGESLELSARYLGSQGVKR